ncbi:JmjC domain, hydroxylase-domain-containing protein [Scheffersomyces amazonensis]|uniref:JmjC domain, hydroxylase-domain-containing protein n=1 Tax=Scheffersomyces amazonensis TaxID=1078765 RepID=UPI00315CAF15
MFRKDLLTPCPVLHPNMDEFSDPIEYLSRADIAKLGAQYGIVKIVPPENWNPQFSISKDFNFHTRLQRISDLGITTRSRQLFSDNINRFLKMRRKRQLKQYFTAKPAKGHHPVKVYYYDLFIKVDGMGGIKNMSRTKWKDLKSQFGVAHDSQELETEFNTNIRSYSNFLKEHNSNYEFPESDSEDEYDNCLICGKHDHPSLTLLCDNCDNPYHTFCLPTPLNSIPSSNWYCDKCLIGTGEYGFEEEVDVKYSLRQFYNLCLEADQDFINKYNNGKPLTVDIIEQKFWEFVDIQKSDLEVKYGADIHNLKPGQISGFPMMDTPGIKLDDATNQFYINHPFNLTKLPFANGSLLNYISTAISGMTIPWIYIGSLLSTFCWHVEDHYTLSANYCHLGATKKWYGIPSSQADKFEKLMRDSAPDLFKRQPDLLHQLVTLLSPVKLVENGIKCVYADQNPGEFIITYPRVYHAGFNCGFNFNEAVNFTMNSWLEFGEKSINDYKSIGKENVFNHYQLLENILRAFNRQRGKIHRNQINLVKKSLKGFEDQMMRQNEYLFKIDKSKFNVEYKPKKIKRSKNNSNINYDIYENYGDDEEDEPLCDICKTHLGYQYCIINNKDRRFQYSKHSGLIDKKEIKEEPKQLLTPKASPYEQVNLTSNIERAELVSANESSRRFKEVIDLVSEEESKEESKKEFKEESKEELCMMAQFDQLVNEAKRKAKEELDAKNEGFTKRRSKRLQEHPVDVSENAKNKIEGEYHHLRTLATSSRMKSNSSSSASLSSRMMGKMTMVQKFSSMKKLNEKDSVLLCLECCTKVFDKESGDVPTGSILLYETYPSQLKELIKETKRNLEEIQ